VFCPWSITQAAQSVPAKFLRVHRSWLVNLDLVAGFERGKDNGWCLLRDIRGLDRVPVSRAQVAAVREALGL
jgi:DNA-binding LytR/AlgR family response regulator